MPIVAHYLHQRIPLPRFRRQALVAGAPRIALRPLGRTERPHPVGGDHGQVALDRPHRLDDEFDPVEGSDGGEDVGRRGAL